ERRQGLWSSTASSRGACWPRQLRARPGRHSRFAQQPYDNEEPAPQPTEPLTRRVAELFNLGYEVLLQVLTRFFTHTDETDEQLDALVHAALGIMGGVLKPLGTALTRLPMGSGH